MKKATVRVEVVLDIEVEDGTDVESVLEEMDYNFVSQTDEGKIVETEIVGWEVTGKDDEDED